MTLQVNEDYAYKLKRAFDMENIGYKYRDSKDGYIFSILGYVQLQISNTAFSLYCNNLLIITLPIIKGKVNCVCAW